MQLLETYSSLYSTTSLPSCHSKKDMFWGIYWVSITDKILLCTFHYFNRQIFYISGLDFAFCHFILIVSVNYWNMDWSYRLPHMSQIIAIMFYHWSCLPVSQWPVLYHYHLHVFRPTGFKDRTSSPSLTMTLFVVSSNVITSNGALRKSWSNLHFLSKFLMRTLSPGIKVLSCLHLDLCISSFF